MMWTGKVQAAGTVQALSQGCQEALAYCRENPAIGSRTVTLSVFQDPMDQAEAQGPYEQST